MHTYDGGIGAGHGEKLDKKVKMSSKSIKFYCV